VNGFFAIIAILAVLAGVPPTRAAGLPPSTPSLPASTPIVRLIIEPSGSVLVGPRAIQRLLVTGLDAAGKPRDITPQARFVSLTPEVARVTRDGIVRPAGDGIATIKAIVGGRSALAAVQVRGARVLRPVSFANEILPVLTHAGCNQGACHGAQHGKGGFRLSLLGFDPDADHETISRQAGSRRLNLAEPERSLLLRKAAAAMPHGGGQRLAVDSPGYRLLLAWVRQGAPGPDPKEPRIVALEVFPAARVMAPPARQPLVVRARFSDGAARDVTAETRLQSLNDGVAEVTPEGAVTARRPGATAVMARYLGLAAVARVSVPFRRAPGSRLPAPSAHQPGAGSREPGAGSAASLIDRLAARKWAEMELEPAAPCSDAEFLRRASLDAVGTLPTPEEVRAFLASRDPEKRVKQVDALLARPEYADYWALKWGDLLRISRSRLTEKGMWSFYNWLHQALRENRSFDAVVRELITAQGSTYTSGPANFFRVARTPPDLAETTSQVFLGVRLQCARCHHHPFEKWSQEDYYSLAAYFARVGLKGSQEFGIFGGEQVVRLAATGEVRHPKSGATMAPRPLIGGSRLPAASSRFGPGARSREPGAGSEPGPGDRRPELAAWLTAKENPFFARNLANRAWAYLMGRGLVEPVDDLRVTNPATNPELLDALAEILVASGFDMKALLRAIMTSQVYQLSSTPPGKVRDELFYSHYRVKRLPAEVLLDAICAATGVPEKFNGLPRGTRAIQLPDAGVASPFLDTFGRPPREIACECERSAEPNIAQALQLMNGEVLNRKLGREEGRVARLVARKAQTADAVTELYLATLSRRPRSAELSTALRLIASAPKREEGLEDLLWTLLNSREFLFNH
jgi:hypothetical protein